MIENRILLKEHEINSLKVFRSFCVFVEEITEGINPKIFIEQFRNHLLTIYRSGLTLSNLYNPSKEDYSDLLNKDILHDKLKIAADILLDSRYYWDVFNPIDENDDKEPVCGDLIDDLEDIYKDIKNTLLLFDLNTNETTRTAMWQFEFQFRTHWGDHCIDALRACHYLVLQNV